MGKDANELSEEFRYNPENLNLCLTLHFTKREPKVTNHMIHAQEDEVIMQNPHGLHVRQGL
jgi:hypothetical protein